MTGISVTGEALVDFVPDAQGTRKWTAGGSGLNTALALARLGVATSFAGTLSRDENGQRLAAFMRAEQISLTHIHESNKPCPHVLVSKNAQGSPHYDLHLAGSALEDAPAIWQWPSGVRHFHATSFASTLGQSGAAAYAALHAAHGVIGTSFDPNIRSGIFPDRALIPLLLTERIRHADIVKVSSEDLDAIAPGILHDHVIGEWRALGIPLLLVTRGAQGAVALSGDMVVEVAAPKVDVCDTVGAGDTFMAAFLAAMHDEQALGARPVFRMEQIARWLDFATRAAAWCCMRPGADPPTRNLLDTQP